jgi:cellulose biosynthesis protein BcsQ
LANQKGGVGKTATTLGLASAISHRGGRALVVDMDPQANATEGLGVYTADGQLTTADLMDRTEPGSAIDAVVATAWDGIDLIPHPGPVQRRIQRASDLVFRLDIAFEGLNLSPYDAVCSTVRPASENSSSRYC